MGRLVFTLCSSIAALIAFASVGSGQVNLAAGRPASASAVYLNETANLAVDADTVTSRWVAPTSAAWIEIDLGREYAIGSVVGKAAMTPSGAIVHNITGRTEAGITYTLGRFSGNAYSEHLVPIPCAEPTPVRYVRVTSVSPVTWIGWVDLRIYEAPSQSTKALSGSWGRLKASYR